MNPISHIARPPDADSSARGSPPIPHHAQLLGETIGRKSPLDVPESCRDLLVVGLRAAVMVIPMVPDELAKRSPAHLQRLSQRRFAGFGGLGTMLLLGERRALPCLRPDELGPATRQLGPKLIPLSFGPVRSLGRLLLSLDTLSQIVSRAAPPPVGSRYESFHRAPRSAAGSSRSIR